MQDSMFIGLDVHMATISVAIARGEHGGWFATGGRSRTGPITYGSW
jgi:hypothetical protein